jgi:predicted lysophospholipase L1 biosynthesis ABC-type transport system permease subunit
MELEGGVAYSHGLLRGNGVLVRPELLAQLRLARGDSILIGGKPFVIRGVLL